MNLGNLSNRALRHIKISRGYLRLQRRSKPITPDDITFADLEHKYQDFCRDRKEMRIQTSRMPDYSTTLFNKRRFNGEAFELC